MLVGASGNLAADAVVKSEPSGHTLLLAGNASIVVNQHIFEKLPYDPLKDLAPIYQVAITPNILVVNPSLPVKTLPEFVEYARTQPEGVSYGHVGVGTSQHLAAVFVEGQAKHHVAAHPLSGRAGDLLRSAGRPHRRLLLQYRNRAAAHSRGKAASAGDHISQASAVCAGNSNAG